jgi:hypothetical protein
MVLLFLNANFAIGEIILKVNIWLATFQSFYYYQS